MQRSIVDRVRPPLVAALTMGLVATGAFGGCGGDDDGDATAVPAEQRAILGTVGDLQTASRNGDATRICEQIFTRTLAGNIARASKHSCAEEVRDTLVTPDARLSVGREIRIRRRRAKAMVREQDGDVSRVFFVKEGGTWRIERITSVGSQ